MARRESAYPRRQFHAEEKPQARLCEADGCPLPGEFRAPRSRDPSAAPRWFCLDHVRDYNRNWNWFEGMSQTEIESAQAQTTTWQRPTWRLGERGATAGMARDPLELLSDIGLVMERREGAKAAEPTLRSLKPEDRRALATLELTAEATMKEVKSRYKDLVKRYHPDRNGGDRAAEARLREVIAAYRHLSDSGLA